MSGHVGHESWLERDWGLHTGTAERMEREALGNLQAELFQARVTLNQIRAHLELAVANIQRLTLENHRLRQQLETATKVTHINPNRWPR